MIKKIAALVLTFSLLLMAVFSGAESKFPELLRFTADDGKREEASGWRVVQTMTVDTSNKCVTDEVNREMAEMTDKARPFLDEDGTEQDKSWLRTMAAVTSTGTKWMSFLMVTRISLHSCQTYVDFSCRTYDMETGAQLSLTDIFPKGSPAWQLLSDEAAAQLSAYFPGEECDREKLQQLTENVADASFSLTPGSLTLHFRADDLYPGKTGLMHVNVLLSGVREYMTDEARQQTDNSAFPLVALTFDDGPARLFTTQVVDALCRHGVQGTFFCVGNMMSRSKSALMWEHDSGNQIGTHSYTHPTNGCTPEEAHRELEQFDSEIGTITGKIPTLMRAPGGRESFFVTAEIGLPLIHWSMEAGDGIGRNYTREDVDIIRRRVSHAKDGDVVLMHDLRPRCFQYVDQILQSLTDQGFRCVTVEELFDMKGIPLEKNQVYTSAGEIDD